MQNNVSNIAIAQMVDSLDTEFMNQMREEAQKIVGIYNSIKGQGILSSAEIDEIINGITSRVNHLENAFSQISAKIKTRLNDSDEAIRIQRQSTQSTLNNGM